MDVLRGRYPGHVERPVAGGEVAGALEDLGRATGVLIGVDEDGAVRVIAEELERAGLECGGPGIVAVRVIVQPHPQNSRGHCPCSECLQVLGGGLGSEREGVTALDVLTRVHGRADVEWAPRVLEPYVVVRSG